MDVLNRLKRLRTEDFIWLIYFFIAAFAVLSNAYERNYILNNSNNSLKKSKAINVTLFFIVFFVYLYFALIFATDLNNMEKNFDNKEYRNTLMKLIASLLFLIGGAIYLVQEIIQDDEVELGII